MILLTIPLTLFIDYLDDGYLVPRNSSVVIARIPATRQRCLTIKMAPDIDISTADPNAKPSEEEAMMRNVVDSAAGGYGQQRGGFGVGNRGRGRDPAGGQQNMYSKQPPPSYVCNRCNQQGHWINHCPTNGDKRFDIRRNVPLTGIPRAFIKTVTRDDGQLDEVAVAHPNELALDVGQSKVVSLGGVKRELEHVPRALICPLCIGLMKEPMFVPCCKVSFCNECIRQALVGTGGDAFICPVCAEDNVVTELLQPNPRIEAVIKDKYSDVVIKKQPVVSSSRNEDTRRAQRPPVSGSSDRRGNHRSNQRDNRGHGRRRSRSRSRSRDDRRRYDDNRRYRR